MFQDNRIWVELESKVLQEIKKYQNKGEFFLEAGGILVGIHDIKSKVYRITDITWPQETDKCLTYRFYRKENGHQEIMDELWEQSGYVKSYLGEWHTHNQKNPSPSLIDYTNWKRIAKRKHNYENLFFIIVGTECIGIWTVENDVVKKIGGWRLDEEFACVV